MHPPDCAIVILGQIAEANARGSRLEFRQRLIARQAPEPAFADQDDVARLCHGLGQMLVGSGIARAVQDDVQANHCGTPGADPADHFRQQRTRNGKGIQGQYGLLVEINDDNPVGRRGRPSHRNQEVVTLQFDALPERGLRQGQSQEANQQCQQHRSDCSSKLHSGDL